MPTVQTARGPVDSAALGTTLMHEHVFVLDREISENFPEDWGSEEQRVADAVARMNELKSRGVDSIVDLTVLGLGRYIPRIQRIAQQTELSSPRGYTLTAICLIISLIVDPGPSSAVRN